MNFKTASSLLESSQKIFTGVGVLDKSLRGGISLGKVTQLVGKPGAGKTEMCLNLCLNVQAPNSVGGLEGKAIFIDTTRGFNPTRLRELARKRDVRYRNIKGGLTTYGMLRNVFYFDCPTASKLVAAIMACYYEHLAKNRNIKLIVIDSICYVIRMLDSVSERTALLMELHRLFHKILYHHNVAICLTNELGNRRRKRKWIMEPILGVKHLHLINEQIWLVDGTCFIGKELRTRRLSGKLDYTWNL